jgi:hypothetical protein
MTTSGTTSFIVSRDDIIKAALQQIVALKGGATLSSNDNTIASFGLNMIIKNLAIKGWLLWCYQNASNTLAVGTQSYDIGPANGVGTFNVARPLRIAQAWRQDANNLRTPLIQLARNDFYMLSPSDQVGIPTNFYYDPKVLASSTATAVPNVGTISIWPVTNVTGYTLYISYQRPIQDIDATGSSSSQNFDLPQEWFLPLTYALAAYLGPIYSVNLSKVNMLQQRADQYIEEVANFSREESSVYFTLDPQMSNNNGF